MNRAGREGCEPKGKDQKRLAPRVERVGDGRSWSQDGTGLSPIHQDARWRTVLDEPAQACHSRKAGLGEVMKGPTGEARMNEPEPMIEKDQTRKTKERAECA